MRYPGTYAVASTRGGHGVAPARFRRHALPQLLLLGRMVRRHGRRRQKRAAHAPSSRAFATSNAPKTAATMGTQASARCIPVDPAARLTCALADAAKTRHVPLVNGQRPRHPSLAVQRVSRQLAPVGRASAAREPLSAAPGGGWVQSGDGGVGRRPQCRSRGRGVAVKVG